MAAYRQQIVDQTLPQLGVALSPAAMSEVFAGALFPTEQLESRYQVLDCEIMQARYKPGKNCLLSYRLTIRDEQTARRREQILCARFYEPGGSSSRFLKAQSQSLAATQFGPPVFHLPNLEMVGWSSVFTPPWNRCAEETFRALDQLGFAALSKSHDGHPATGYKFREISITFDPYRWKGDPAMKSPESIIEELVTQVNELDTIGIMLHHKVMDTTAFSLLERLIGTLRIFPGVRFHTFQSLLSLGAHA